MRKIESILNEPIVVIMVGNIGMGKTTIAKILESKLNAQLLSGDELVRNNECTFEKTYGTISDKLVTLINSHKNVIIDGPYLTDESRDPFLLRAENNGYNSLVIDCGIGTEKDLICIKHNNKGCSPEELQKEFEVNILKYQKPEEKYNNQCVITKEELLHLFDEMNTRIN